MASFIDKDRIHHIKWALIAERVHQAIDQNTTTFPLNSLSQHIGPQILCYSLLMG